MAGIVDALSAERMAQEGAAYPQKTALELQRARLDMQEAAQNHQMEMQKFQQQQQDRMAQQQQERAAQAAQSAGLRDYVDIIKSGVGGSGGPNVSVTGASGGPQAPTMDFDSVSKSLLKKNPNISPEEFSAAMDKFQPMFDKADKMKLAQFSAALRVQSRGPGTVEEQIYATALKQGKSPEEAANAALNYKRSQGIAGAELTPEGGINMRTGAEPAITAAAKAKETGTKEGELDVKKEAAQPKLKAGLEELKANVDNMDQFFDQAEKLAGGMTTGAGAYLAGVKGTDAYNLARVVDTLKSNIGFDKLQQLRDQSPTGSALGRITNFEMQTLQNVVASLDPGQGKDQFLQHLQIAKKAVKEGLKRVQDAYDETYSKTDSTPAAAPASGLPAGWSVQIGK